jgi:hypothetical protein
LRVLRVVTLLALGGIMAALRGVTFNEPPDRDVAAYAVIGHGLLAGRDLYSDLWDHKPPAIHISYAAAEWLAGPGQASIFLLSMVTALATMLGIYCGARWANVRESIALWGCAVWTSIAFTFDLQGNAPNTEAFVNAALVWAVALTVRLCGGDRIGMRSVMVIGALFTTATLYKHVAVVAPIVVGAAFLLIPCTPSISSRLRVVATWAACGVLGWLVVSGYFAASNRFQDFSDAVFSYNRYYAQTNASPSVSLWRIFPGTLWFAAPLLILSMLGALAAGRRQRMVWVMSIAYLVSAPIMVWLPGAWYPHYYLLWLPPLVLSAAMGLEATTRLRLWHAPALIGGVVLISLCVYSIPTYQHGPEPSSRLRHGYEYLAARDLAGRLREAPQTLSLYAWGAEPGIYFHSRSTPPAGVFYAMPLIAGPLSANLLGRVFRQLDSARVELVIVNHFYPLHPQMHAYLNRHFREVSRSRGFDFDKPVSFYVRPGVELPDNIIQWSYSEVSQPRAD